MWMWSTKDFPDLTLDIYVHNQHAFWWIEFTKLFTFFFVVVAFQLHFERPFLREKTLSELCWSLCDTSEIAEDWKYRFNILLRFVRFWYILLPSLVNRMHCANRIKIRFFCFVCCKKKWWSSDCMLMREC